jgi:4-deoxy-L-threo-5-hexosulose-uronate ketol-isomerase
VLSRSFETQELERVILMKILQMADAIRYRTMTTKELRETFLIDDLFRPGQIGLRYVDLDRTVIGSAVPTGEPLKLPTADALKASYFTERRELGILNIGGGGAVTVNDVPFELKKLDALYVGRGNEEVVFSSSDEAQPAEFYLLSYPAHAMYATQLIRSAEQQKVTLGTAETANLRTITKLIHLEGTRSCQLVMGFTQLASGSVWNTMPPHTHMRRSEVYLYFDIDADQRVIHLMGPGHETRNIVIANKQVVISPGWSIHAGVGTKNYTFCWGMGGENQVYSDMDGLAIADLL